MGKCLREIDDQEYLDWERILTGGKML